MSAETATDNQKLKQHIFVIRELTKREIKRKYARSYLGILWSVLDPLLHMAVITVIFSYVFSRSIENYPAYYLTGYILFSFFSTSTRTSMTALKDNAKLMGKTKLQRETFIRSRIYTALVNLGFSCIAMVAVLIFFRIQVTPMLFLFPVDVFFLMIFSSGISYLLSIWYIYHNDAQNIYTHIITILRFFVALFYSVDRLNPYMQNFVIHNPVYSFIKIARDSILYGKVSEPLYWIQILAWSIGFYILGKIIFKKNENAVLGRL